MNVGDVGELRARQVIEVDMTGSLLRSARLRLCFFSLLWTCLCAVANIASAQVANCPLNVTGAAGAPKFAVDGMLLLRYAVGSRGRSEERRVGKEC